MRISFHPRACVFQKHCNGNDRSGVDCRRMYGTGVPGEQQVCLHVVCLNLKVLGPNAYRYSMKCEAVIPSSCVLQIHYNDNGNSTLFLIYYMKRCRVGPERIGSKCLCMFEFEDVIGVRWSVMS